MCSVHFVEEAVKRGGIYLLSITRVPGFIVTRPELYQYLPPYNMESEKKNRQKAGRFLVVFNTDTIHLPEDHALDVSVCLGPCLSGSAGPSDGMYELGIVYQKRHGYMPG